MTKLFAGRPAALALHCSLVLIIAGALVTAFSARKGTVHIRKGESASAAVEADGRSFTMPFSVELEDFEVVYHPGTDSPSDYRSRIRIADGGKVLVEGDVMMNRIMSCKGYRFYQTDYDSDSKGVTFTVTHDPAGIAVVYTGYAIFLLALLCFFFTDKRFRRFFKVALRGSAAVLALVFFFAGEGRACAGTGTESAGSRVAAEAKARQPKVLPKEVAADFGRLYVQYHGRICPLQSVASDWSAKLYGASGVRGLSDEQVLTGWMFFSTSWKDVPQHRRRNAMDATDKEAAVRALYSGELLKIYPLRDSTGRLGWYSQSDRLPDGISDGEWMFVRKSMDYIFELVVNKEYDSLHASLEKLRTFQERKMGDSLPKKSRIRAERLYNALPPLFPVAGMFLILGLAVLAVNIRQIVRGEVLSGRKMAVTGSGIFRNLAAAGDIVFFVLLTTVLALLWIAAGHIPMSNGAETMLTIAWTASLSAAIFFRRFPTMLPFGLVVAALATLVSAMGNANPALTQLTPVLSSPLLSIHVSLMMLSYTVLAVIMVNGVCGLAVSLLGKDEPSSRMARMSEAIMYPTLFFLGSGIIAGSVWANVSWGCYWNWDPKETWALITFLTASVGVHRAKIPFLRSPKAYHIYTLILSASVLFTYFGVNYLLGGLHSYA